MSDINEDAVVAYSQIKHAALYFPHVVPLPSFIFEDLMIEAAAYYIQHGMMPSDIEQRFHAELPDKARHWVSLLPPRLSSDRKFVPLLQKLSLWDAIHSTFTRLGECLEPSSVDPEKKSGLESIVKKTLRVSLFHEQSLERTYEHLVRSYQLHQLPALIPKDCGCIDSNGDPGSEDFRITLINIGLVNPSKASWDQILAYRADVESKKKLQRLQRFFLKNYAGLSRTEIEDDLHTRLDDHAAVVRKFGFEVHQTMLEAVFTSKPLQSGLGGALIAAFCEQPLTATLSGLAGIVLDIGNTVLRLRQQRFEFKESIEQHPLSYIISAIDQLAEKHT